MVQVIAGIRIIYGNDIFGIMILDLHKTAHLLLRALREPDAGLYIDSFISANGHKVDLLGVILAGIHIVPPALQLQKHNVLHGSIQYLSVIARQGIFQRHIRKVVFFPVLQDFFTFQIIPLAGIEDKRLLQPA